MKKSTSIVKRIIALFLVVLMSINTFAAVVSDNDGSAFITKAEFDSLKNDFQSQINQYNTSIDSKIDGAIASYLAGITVAKSTPLSFIGNIKHFLDINKFESQDARIDLWHGIAAVDKGGTDGNWMAGYEGNAIIQTPGTTGRGVFAEPLSDSNDGKSLLLKGFGSFTDKVTTMVLVATTDRGPLPGVSGRVQNWALTWTAGSRNDITTAGYIDFFKKKGETTINFYPITYGQDSVNMGYNSGGTYKKTPNRYAHERSVNYSDEIIGYNVNDQTITTLYDSELINGVRTMRDNTFNSTINGNFNFVNNNFNGRTFINDNNNPVWREWNYLQNNGDTSWILIGNASSNLYLNMRIEISSWNQSQIGTSARWNGYNTEMYAANINNPNRIWTDKYTSNEWNEWAKKNITEDAIKFYKNTYLWNIRYGNLLVAENIKDSAKYKLDVKNNGTSDCYIKFFTGIQSKNFDEVDGIKTNKSDSTNKEAIKITPGTTLNIEFEVFDSNPIFFKCSNGADITFGDSLIKEE